jgi:hypothetical protein
MRILAALALATAALSATVAAPANAADDGCVTTLLKSDDPSFGQVVILNPDGSITVNPNPVTSLGSRWVGRATWLVDCVV